MDKNEIAEHGEVIVRRATLADVEGMHALINHFANEGLMLAKSRSNLYQNIRDFYVAERVQDGQGALVGCGALHVLWVDLGEIRSVAVDKRYQGDRRGAPHCRSAPARMRRCWGCRASLL